MPLFQDRQGKWHESKPHIATFRGIHNKAKSKVLIYLFSRYEHGLSAGLSAKELHNRTGVLLTTLRTHLLQWSKQKYVNRRAVEGSRPHYTYTIAERGARFVSIRIPPDKYNEYVKEINEYIKNKAKKY
jgi:DNA-binding HxlR family transcriptional regulator